MHCSVGVSVTKSAVQSSARNKHMNERVWITLEYSDLSPWGSFAFVGPEIFVSGGQNLTLFFCLFVFCLISFLV